MSITQKVMGILNVTPDSFSDGGSYSLPEQALERARVMISEGASIIDIGGESSRPGAEPVPLTEELARVLPVVKLLRAYIDHEKLSVDISVDTYKTEVMRQALDLGANMINDICALQEQNAAEVCVKYQAKVCLMHMSGEPKTMQDNPPCSDNIIQDVYDFLSERVAFCTSIGMMKENIYIDPGFGFGKTFDQNWELLANMGQLLGLGCKILVGTSRKSMLGNLLERPLENRLAGGIASAMIALEEGATILRVHDVSAHMDALRVFDRVKEARKK